MIDYRKFQFFMPTFKKYFQILHIHILLTVFWPLYVIIPPVFKHFKTEMKKESKFLKLNLMSKLVSMFG